MKALTVTFCLCAIGIIALATLATKPTDQECINYLRTGKGFAGHLEYNKYSLQVEDHIFYKKIYSSIDGTKLGTGIFGTVIMN